MILNENNIYYVWLSKQLGAGSAAPKKLLHQFENAKAVYECKDYSLFSLTPKQNSSLMDKNLLEAKRAISSSLNLGFHVISYEDDNYPQKLRELSNPPMVIYCKGSLVDLNKHYTVGIVGTRHPSKEAEEITRKISTDLAKEGVIIISGLALGIDAEAHSSALLLNSFTVGVSGVKAGTVYPKEHDFLYRNMYENGLVVCEHSPTDTVSKSSFPIRNRIISALSDILLMIEAPTKSGALITAEKSFALKKPVFVPPGDYNANEGGRQLLKKGAFPLHDTKDILNNLSKIENKSFLSPEEIFRNKSYDSMHLIETHTSIPHILSTNTTSEPKENVLSVPDELTQLEAEIYKCVKSNNDLSTDSIISISKVSASEATAALSVLEIYGYVKRLPGNKWRVI